MHHPAATRPPRREVVPAYETGTPAYRRVTTALWFAGAGTFMVLYSVQALLPLFSQSFDVSPAASSLALSAATGTLALAIIPVSVVAEQWGRRRVMTISLTATAVLGLIAPLSPSFEFLLVVRALQGIAMAGVPALSMGHLTQEISRRSLGHAMGVLIAGNTLGGLSGRMLAEGVAAAAGWRAAMAAVGALSLLCLAGFRLLIPEPRAPASGRVPLRTLAVQIRGHLADSGVRRACLISFALMSGFVTMYNFLDFRLLAAPYSLPHGLVGLVFLAYLGGTLSSPGAGRLGDRFGRLPVIWASIMLAAGSAVLSLAEPLPLVLLALVLFTMAFFAAHSVTSGWLNERTGAGAAQASALYLFSYYAGSSVGGTAGGFTFEAWRWPGAVGYIVALASLALAAAYLLARTPARTPARGSSQAS